MTSAEQVDPTRTTRDRDLVRYPALVLGYEMLDAEQRRHISFPEWRAAVELTLDYLAAWDRRAR